MTRGPQNCAIKMPEPQTWVSSHPCGWPQCSGHEEGAHTGHKGRLGPSVPSVLTERVEEHIPAGKAVPGIHFVTGRGQVLHWEPGALRCDVASWGPSCHLVTSEAFCTGGIEGVNGPCGREAWETRIAQGFCPSVYRQGPQQAHQVINVQERTGARHSSDHSLRVPTRWGENAPGQTFTYWGFRKFMHCSSCCITSLWSHRELFEPPLMSLPFCRREWQTASSSRVGSHFHTGNELEAWLCLPEPPALAVGCRGHCPCPCSVSCLHSFVRCGEKHPGLRKNTVVFLL